MRNICIFDYKKHQKEISNINNTNYTLDVKRLCPDNLDRTTCQAVRLAVCTCSSNRISSRSFVC